MSEFTAIRAVTQTLKEILEAHITNSTEPELNGVPIDLRSPREMRGNGQPSLGISLWLYQVSRNADLLNHPPQRPAPDRILRHALPIDLYYLVTPLASEPADEQALMGKVLQVFNDHPNLRGSDLKDSLQNTQTELRLILEAPTLEELTRVWHALQEPYQLSVTYLVQVLSIHSDLEPVQSSPVAVRETEYDQILAVT
jgi:hypothetical protein